MKFLFIGTESQEKHIEEFSYIVKCTAFSGRNVNKLSFVYIYFDLFDLWTYTINIIGTHYTFNKQNIYQNKYKYKKHKIIL